MKHVVLAIVIWGVMLLPVQAAGAGGLYEAQVTVSSQSSEEQSAAVKEAFQKVLLKVMGHRHALAEAPLTSLLEEAPKLVQQFRYDTPEGENGTTTFWVRFDSRGVKQLLRQRGLPMWGRARPTLLLWVAVEDGSQRYLLDASIASPIAEILQSQAERRGMTVLFPLWDLEDQSQLSFTDVWGNFPEPILAASNRYPTSVQLVGRLLRQGEEDWQARWTLYGAEQGRSWRVEGELEQALRAGIDEAVDVIAARIAPVTGNNSQSSVQIRVTEVTSFMDYARLFSYLSGLSQVTAIQPVQLSRTEAKFRLKLQGGAEALAASIQFGRSLAQVAEGGATEPGGTNRELNYRLLP